MTFNVNGEAAASRLEEFDSGTKLDVECHATGANPQPSVRLMARNADDHSHSMDITDQLTSTGAIIVDTVSAYLNLA